jgi:dihydropteroate synthase
LEGSLAAAIISLMHGAHILRVHDVRETRRAARVADAILARPEMETAADTKTKEAGHDR